jgi:hypothetical protein
MSGVWRRSRTVVAWALYGVLAGAQATEIDDLPSEETFDCVDAFDLFAAYVIFRCAVNPMSADDTGLITRAVQRLDDQKLLPPRAFDELKIDFCPLASATGIAPTPAQIYIDDGLRAGSAEGLAEVIAHEWVHTRQFKRLGEREFKCTYVREMAECGGCQDRHHALEREAYEKQDVIRNSFLREWGIEPTR